MSVLERSYPGDAAAFTAVLVAVQITAVALLAWLLAGFAGRRRAAWRSAVWLGALLAVLASPVASVALRSARVSLVSVSLPAARAAPIAPMPVGDGPDQGDTPIGASAAGEAAEDVSVVAPTAARGRSGPSHAAVRSWNDLHAVGGAAFLVWIAGCVFCFVRFLLGCRWVLGLYRDTTRLDEPSHAATFARVRHTLGVARLPAIVTSPRVRGPVAVGGVVPARVIVPEGFAATVDAHTLHDVLVHECAHVLQRDPYVGLLQRLAEMLFWPHVLVHWLNRRLAAAREELCDNYVLRGSEATHYSRTLLRLSELAPAPPPLAAAGLLRPMDDLPARVAGLLDEGRNRMTRVSNWKTALLTAAVLVPVVCVAGTRVLTAEPQPLNASSMAAGRDAASPATGERDSVREEPAGLMRNWEVEGRARMEEDARVADDDTSPRQTDGKQRSKPDDDGQTPPKEKAPSNSGPIAVSVTTGSGAVQLQDLSELDAMLRSMLRRRRTKQADDVVEVVFTVNGDHYAFADLSDALAASRFLARVQQDAKQAGVEFADLGKVSSEAIGPRRAGRRDGAGEVLRLRRMLQRAFHKATRADAKEQQADPLGSAMRRKRDRLFPQTLRLTKRTNPARYDGSAFSFRYMSQSAAVHRNYVDLAYGGCGLLHVNLITGTRNRVVDVGARPLGDLSEAPDEGWLQRCVWPRQGHVYVQRVDYGVDPFYVQFRVLEVSDRSVVLEWSPIEAADLPSAEERTAISDAYGQPPSADSGGELPWAGLAGMCGGPHREW